MLAISQAELPGRLPLVDALEAKGLRLRSDSKLCENYIEDGVGNVTSIVGVMMNMHIAFKHSITEISVFPLKRLITEENETDYGLNMVWKAVRIDQWVVLDTTIGIPKRRNSMKSKYILYSVVYTD